MHPVSTTKFTWHWRLLNTSLLLNYQAQFQNIHGEEMTPIKKVMTQYVQVMLNLCLTVYNIYIRFGNKLCRKKCWNSDGYKLRRSSRS